jgi:hypothetical protein
MINHQTNKLEASMLRLTVWTCLLVLAVAGPAWSVPFIMAEYGDQMPWLGSDINAMGGTGAALYRGGMSNIFNPAFLAVETSNRLDAGLSLDQEHEDRFQPLYDTFDNVVTDMAIASNRHHYWQTGFGLVLHDASAGIPLSVGLSLADRYPYSYTFDEEVRDPTPFGSPSEPRDSIIENRQLKMTGTLRAASLGVGGNLADWLSLGGALHYAFGTRTETVNRRVYDESYYDDDLTGLDRKYESNMSGINFTVGLRAKVSDRVEIGVAYENPLTASGSSEVLYNETHVDTNNDLFFEGRTVEDAYYRYPQIIRGGFTFYPQTDPKTVFTAEVEYIPWEKFEDSRYLGPTEFKNFEDGETLEVEMDGSLNLEKTVDVRIGLEHTFYNGVPVRFGFRHLTSYQDKEADSTVFTGGTGMPLGGGLISLSVELMKITSYQEQIDIFPYPDDGDFYAEDLFRFEDTRFRIGASYMVRW